jgi:hypothetical protein
MYKELISNRFVYYCCTPPIDSLVVFEGDKKAIYGDLPMDLILLENDLLVGVYLHPDTPTSNIYFGILGLYVFFNQKKWTVVEYKSILNYDLFHKTDDYHYNLTHPFFIMKITSGEIIPLDIKLVPYYRSDGTFSFIEIFRIERFVRWCIWHSNKSNE